MTKAPKKKAPLRTVELTAEEARTLIVSLAADIKRRTIHMHSAVDPKRAAIETELKSLQAVYDKCRACDGRLPLRSAMTAPPGISKRDE